MNFRLRDVAYQSSFDAHKVKCRLNELSASSDAIQGAIAHSNISLLNLLCSYRDTRKTPPKNIVMSSKEPVTLLTQGKLLLLLSKKYFRLS